MLVGYSMVSGIHIPFGIGLLCVPTSLAAGTPAMTYNFI